MKKIFSKENILTLLIYTTIFIVFFLILTNNHTYGSKLDFQNQHFLIPEYFRTNFYANHDLLPDFAFNLGSGQNIYYLSYYGLLSPIILISYLFPNISMLTFITITSSIIVILSSFLMYLYLKNQKLSNLTSFLGGLILLLSAPLIFHSHRHIMFINYMAFLILGMFGVDRYFKNKKTLLLIISTFLIIMTSYYYSVGALICLFILGISKYLKTSYKNFKLFIKDMFKFAIPFIIAILMSMVLLLPTAYTLLSGREKGNTSINLLDLIIPNLDFKNILYTAYSTGLTALSILSATYFLKEKDKQKRFLSIIIILVGLFPIFNYVLNGTLYIDPKSLIPLLPLIVLITSCFIEQLFQNKIKKDKVIKIIAILFILGLINIVLIKLGITSSKISQAELYLADLILLLGIILIQLKTKNKFIFATYIVIIFIGSALTVNLYDNLMPKDYENKEDEQVINEITSNDKDFYRINNYLLNDLGINKIMNENHYQSTIYSSAFNKEYNRFYYDVFNNPITYRNRSMTAQSSNILFNNFIGEKYIITDKNMNLGYLPQKETSNLKIYKNNDAYPIGYATDKLMSKEEYNNLSYPQNVVGLLTTIITDNKTTNEKLPTINKIKPTFSILEKTNLSYEIKDNSVEIEALKNARIKLKINEDLTNKVLFIRFKNNHNPSCKSGDLGITINNTLNKLTCKEWKYHNKNLTFDYVLYNTQELDIELIKGHYELGNIEFFTLDYDLVKNINKEVDKFNIEKQESDSLIGNINVTQDGYFTIQIPYDLGFNITVDEKQVDYEKVNDGFIGFEIKKGHHKIKIKYEAPLKKQGLIITLIGFSIMIIYVILPKRRVE